MTIEVPPLAGVVGFPIGHSKSPVLHGHWLKRYNIPGYYIPLPIQPQDFESAIRSLPRLGFLGVNVTLPYKQTVISLADRVTDRAALIGSANTLTFRDGGLIYADNTDGYGFIENLRQSQPEWDARSGPALVIGAGGAARAVVSSLLAEGVPELRIANRTRQRAEMLRDTFGAKITVVDWNRASDAMEGAMTIVNTTSLGMVGQPELNISFAAAHGAAIATDLVYNPLRTPILQAADAAGLRTVDGLGMLLHQAAPGFRQWFDHKPEVDDELRQAVLSA
ncbi:shikimate dehydrogenase [Pontivivens insulae]|uniref:Shikimate dehydrogenase (NADP(+)) n=1 Tax=Pontivivens insulae TaxID=1639689 RepID=A0A2R8A7M7_9RHOB|nr:shikimate dehydrogenase [Pontivivens insulae]RED18333.1 shikimate dehydrogenase [Pontivivens insulae]SPF28231.1 Shikimate dehydrogenase (NADP(+)) [Pontivivens insulae]